MSHNIHYVKLDECAGRLKSLSSSIVQGGKWVEQRFGDAVVRGPERGLSLDGTARVANYWVRLRAGMRASFPLGALGEVGIEAG